jgi:tetratricopeptide (TPR) repeat protein
MTRKMTLTVTDVRASQNTQLLLERSNLEQSTEVRVISEKLENDPTNSELWMQKGLGLAKQMLFREAVEAYSIGLTHDPFNALLLRHKGHRLISLYRFEEAAYDLELSSRIDPSNWDTWYHLGLAYYLIGDFSRARFAYYRCLEITDYESESLVAVIDWLYLTLKRLGRDSEVARLLDLVDEDTSAGENYVYKDRILMYKGQLSSEQVLDYEGKDLADLELATQGYGVAMHYYFNSDKERMKELFDLILEHNTYWSAFGYIAAYQDNKRL